MGTGIKVGMVAVLIVVVVAIFFFVNQNKKTGNTSAVVPMNAPAQNAVPSAKRAEPTRGQAGEKPVTPVRTTPSERPAPGEQRSIITPPPGRLTPPTTQPAVARPPGTLPPGPTSAPTAGPAAPRPTPTPKPAEPTSQPRTPPPPLPPLVTPEAASRPTSAAEPVETPLIKTTPGVSPPPRPETEPPAATPLPAQPSPPPKAVRKYTVAEGETLWSIAEEQYGDPFLWTKLRAANPGISENVNSGQVINLPTKEELLAPAQPAAKPVAPTTEAKPDAKPAADAEPPKPTNGAHTYVVAKNDTLYSIAAKQLGNSNRWRELLELNKDKLAKPEDLQVGMELKMPAKEGTPSKGKTEPAKPEPKKNGLKKKT